MTSPQRTGAPRLRDGRHRGSLRGRLFLAGLLVGSLGLFAIAGLVLTRSWRPRRHELNMLVDIGPIRALLARRIAEEGRRHHLDITLSTRSFGALEALDLVDAPNPINLALIPGGISGRDHPNVRQVTALLPEALHLVVRPELADGGLAALRGKRINLGPASTAAHHLARDVLEFAGFPAPAGDDPGTFRAETLGPDELQRRLAKIAALAESDRPAALAELPDAAFLLAPVPSVVVKAFVHEAGYRLIPLPFADAYCLDRLTPAIGDEIRVDRASVTPIEIPAYTYSTDPPAPASTCRTVSTRLLLVAYGPTDREAIARLLETVFDSPLATLIQPPPLRDQAPQYPFHPGTEQYLRRNEPLLTPELAANLGKLAGGLGALVSGIAAFYGFLRVLQLRRFESYYQEIRRIELLARGQETDPAAPTDPAALRDYLEGRLLDLKSQAITDFAEGGLKGEILMAGIVALINDTRETLARTMVGG